MKKFFKALFSVFSFIVTVVGLLAVFDKFANKNRIEGDYLNCNQPEEDAE